MSRRVARAGRFLVTALLCVAFRPAVGQEEFGTEIRLAYATAPGARPNGGAQARQLEPVLRRRLALFGGDGGSVTVRSAEDIVVLAPTAQVGPLELKALTRPGTLEIRLLDGVRTNLNRDGRYSLETRTVQTTKLELSYRIREIKTQRLIPIEEFARRSPLLASAADLEPGASRVLRDAGTVLRLVFNKRAAGRLNAAGRRPGRLIVTLLDGALLGISATQVRVSGKDRKQRREQDEPLDSLDLSEGFGSPEEAGLLATVLESGELPVPLRVVGTQLTTFEKKSPKKESQAPPEAHNL